MFSKRELIFGVRVPANMSAIEDMTEGAERELARAILFVAGRAESRRSGTYSPRLTSAVVKPEARYQKLFYAAGECDASGEL